VIERAKVKELLKVHAKEVYEAAEDKSVLVFDSPMKRDIFTQYEEVKVIVSQDEQKTKWVAVTVPAEEGTFVSRVYFPEAWAGLRDEELAAASGIEGAIFCHKERFIFVAKSREEAETAARAAR
jgi:uncharacterized UPF0160 family protein